MPGWYLERSFFTSAARSCCRRAWSSPPATFVGARDAGRSNRDADRLSGDKRRKGQVVARAHACAVVCADVCACTRTSCCLQSRVRSRSAVVSGWKSTRDGPPTQTCTPHRSQRLPLVLNCLVAYNSGRSTSADQRARLDASRTLWPATCRSAASAHCPARDTQADDEHKRAWLAPPNTWAGKITDLGGGMPSLGTAIVTARARLGTQSPRRRKGGWKEQRFAEHAQKQRGCISAL